MRLGAAIRLSLLLVVLTLGLSVPTGTARAAPSCSWLCVCTVAADTLDFAGGSPFDFTAREATTIVTVTCDLTFEPAGNYVYEVDIRLFFDAGLSGNPTSRKLAQAGQRLDYALFRDPARTKPLGDGTAGSYVLEDILTISRPQRQVSRTYTVYGRLPGGQNRRVGGYFDTVTVMLEH